MSISQGNCILFLDEMWLLNEENILSNIPGAHFVSHTSINSLVDPYFKRWNELVVRQVFSEDLASKSINKPLFEQVQHDTLLWRVEKNGDIQCEALTGCVSMS